MVVHNFKKIAPIPSASEMIDIVLTRTQRKTPTVIHPGYKITRIRNFYMRKIKFTQQTIDEKLGAILQDFPRLDDIHPFYADLMNILYDRDHFKLALGQVNTAKNIIQTVSKDYLRLIKYGDSLYRCKQLKRAALGRMCTVLKKLRAAFGYLEEVRKHISRLPALDPNTRTLLLTGYPNVGKSSFMNQVTRADVDVQPYAFTTKALFVGHMDHRFLRWQVVDTPGILDRPLEERNTIEMQAITALAHLRCCVLYFLDISEQCGYTLEQQLGLFESIRPLFGNKQVIVVANKIDVTPYESLPLAVRQRIETVATRAKAEVVPMSNVSAQNVSKLKLLACDKLLEARVEEKTAAGKIKDDVLARLTVVQPKPRDDLVRDSFVPESLRDREGAMETDAEKTTERDLMWRNGGPGVYVCDYRKYYSLEQSDWRFDTLPEIMDGKNVLDYFDPDIEARLNALEEEERALEESGAYEVEDEDEDALNEEERLLHAAIKEKQSIARQTSRLSRDTPKSRLLKSQREEDVRERLEEKGMDAETLIQRVGMKRRRDEDDEDGDDDNEGEMSVDGEDSSSTKQAHKRPRRRVVISAPTERGGKAVAPSYTLPADKEATVRKSLRTLDRKLFREARGGEADRRHYPKLVKHLNSGKRSLGTSTIGR